MEETQKAEVKKEEEIPGRMQLKMTIVKEGQPDKEIMNVRYHVNRNQFFTRAARVYPWMRGIVKYQLQKVGKVALNEGNGELTVIEVIDHDEAKSDPVTK